MRSFRLALSVVFLCALPGLAQQDLAISVGQLSGSARITSTGAALNRSNGAAFQVSYGRYMRSYRFADLYGDVNVLMSPYESISSTATAASKNFASLYVTPGIRLKFFAKKKLSPWAVIGGGYALYMSSKKTIAGGTAAGAGNSSSGALELGGGLDYRWSPRMSFRFDVRNYYTGSPKYNLPMSTSGQLNFVAGGGLVFHFGK